VTILAPPVVQRAAAVNPPMATEINPNVVTPSSSLKYGGRIEGLAINPVNTQIVLAASELGGLWRSTDGAETWSHVDALPLTRMYDVKFAAADPSLVVATGDNDGASPSRGGIWISTDGGTTWSRPASANDDNTDCGANANPGAHWLDIAGTTPGHLSIFVATDCGISVSTDSGVTWTHHFASGGPNARYWDVKAVVVSGQIQAGACGDAGYTQSTDGGASWSANLGDTSELFGAGAIAAPPCHVAFAPNDSNTVFLSSFERNTVAPACSSILQMSTSAFGATQGWTNLNACPNNDRNGRFPFVVTHADPTNPTAQFEVYFGDNTRVTIQTCTYGPTTCATGPWPYYDGNNPHNGTDPSDVVFDPTIPNGCPAFESGDGGVYQPSDCSTNPGSWNMMNTDLNALDALNIAGSVYTSPAHTDVYFGTQDNGLFSSTDSGATYNRHDYDIYSLLADHDQTTNSPPTQVLWRDAAYVGPPTNHVNLSNEDISSTSTWSSAPPLPPGNNPSDNYSATQFGYNSYAFITPDSSTTPNYTMWVTTNGGSSWTQMGPTAPGSPVGFPQASGTPAHPVFYILLSLPSGNKLYRLQGPMNASAVWTDVTSNLSNPTSFGVHPSNPLLLYANDAGTNNSVMKSTNGGATWVPDTNLTTLAQRGGQFPFANGGSQIAAFGFDGNSDTIMAGANNSGVFASTDGGTNWFSVTGAENLPRIAGFFFDQRTDTIYFASGGRGMWKINLPVADLSITKTSNPNPVIAGNQLTYTVSVTNNGSSPSTANNVGVIDTLPPQASFLTSSDGCTEGPPGTLNCAVPSLPPGASFTFTITALVHSDTVTGTGGATTITNTASVAAPGTVDPNPADNTATATTTVVDSADLAVHKLCKPDTTIYEGQVITCSVFVDNYGPSWARNVVLDDTTLSNGPFVIGNVSDLSCTNTPVTGGQDLTCPIGDLANESTTHTGQYTLTYTVTGQSASVYGQNVDNTASARSDTPDPNPNNNTATVNLSVTAMSDLSLSKVGPSSVTAGTPITWTLQANNGGPSDAANATITDTVPAGVTITSVSMPSATCTTGVAGDPTQPSVCQFGTLTHGATSATMTITAVVNPQTKGTLLNNASVSSTTFDPDMSNNLASSSTTVNVVSDLTVVKTATPNPVIAGTALSYQIIVKNPLGPSTTTSVTLTDPLPAGETFLSTGGVGTCGFQTNTNTVTCTLPDIDPGGSDIVYVYTLVKSSTLPGTLTNTATAMGTGSAPVSGSAMTTVNASADLGVVLTSDATSYKPSSTIHYNITVTNAGPSDAQNVVVVQNLPVAKNGYYVSNNLPVCPPPVGLSLTCSYTTVPLLVTIPNGGSVSFQVNFHITGNKGTITSSATVTSATPDPNTANNLSIRNVTVHN
jgi:uncharacterized repeat protein (TIGR01451 family)